jgi:hypothetical protein
LCVPLSGDYRLDLRFGTFCPARRASDRPMAIACLRLFTFFPDLPLRNVPALRSCNALPTFLLLARLYFRAMGSSAMIHSSSASLRLK